MIKRFGVSNFGVLGGLTLLLTIALGSSATPGQTPSPIQLSRNPLPPTQPIRVGTKEIEPFISVQPDVIPYGYSADLWHAIAEDLNLETTWVTYDTVSDMLDGVKQGEVDVAIAGISITSQREAAGLDFSYPFYQSGLQLMVAQANTTVGIMAGFLHWNNLRPIFMIFASSTLVGGLIWLVERKHNDHFSGNPIEGISQGIWFAIVTLGTFGYGDVIPTKFTGRLIATLWMGLSFFIVADFIASLTVHQLSERQVDLQTLRGEPVGAIAGTTGEIFLQSQPVQLKTYPGFDAAIAALETGEIQGMVQDSPALRHFINHTPNRFELTGSLLTHEGYGIAVRDDDAELLDAIDQRILDYQQRGLLEDLHRKWFNGMESEPISTE